MPTTTTTEIIPKTNKKGTSIAKLYNWLAKNEIDIDYGQSENDLILNLSMQIEAQFIEPRPELLEILDEVFKEQFLLA